MVNNRVFTEIDLRLSTVKRWGILHTIRQQSVAEHCFNVAIMAERIARVWFNITDAEVIASVYQWALVHDHPESLSGDVPTIVKDLFDETRLEHRYRDLIPDVAPIEEARAIVKIADRLDAIIFLCMEESMGNGTVATVRESIEHNLFELFNSYHRDELTIGIPGRLKVLYGALMNSLFPLGQFDAQHYDRRGH